MKRPRPWKRHLPTRTQKTQNPGSLETSEDTGQSEPPSKDNGRTRGLTAGFCGTWGMITSSPQASEQEGTFPNSREQRRPDTRAETTQTSTRARTAVASHGVCARPPSRSPAGEGGPQRQPDRTAARPPPPASRSARHQRLLGSLPRSAATVHPKTGHGLLSARAQWEKQMDRRTRPQFRKTTVWGRRQSAPEGWRDAHVDASARAVLGEPRAGTQGCPSVHLSRGAVAHTGQGEDNPRAAAMTEEWRVVRPHRGLSLSPERPRRLTPTTPSGAPGTLSSALSRDRPCVGPYH